MVCFEVGRSVLFRPRKHVVDMGCISAAAFGGLDAEALLWQSHDFILEPDQLPYTVVNLTEFHGAYSVDKYRVEKAVYFHSGQYIERFLGSMPQHAFEAWN